MILSLRRRVKAGDSGIVRRILRNVLWCIVCAFIMTAASQLLLNILARFVSGVKGVITSHCKANAQFFSAFVVTLVFAPIMEEITFRGVMVRYAPKALPKVFVYLFSAILFGIWHRNPGQFIYTTFLGVFWAIIAQNTGRLLETMFLHFLLNLFSLMAYSDSASYILGECTVLCAIRKWLYDFSLWESTLALTVCIAALVLLTLLFLGWTKNEKKQHAQTTPKT